LVKNVAEQQNYQQSLSPEKKTQILCNDADAHKNNASPFLLRKRSTF
jgi:hypothetical protein